MQFDSGSFTQYDAHDTAYGLESQRNSFAFVDLDAAAVLGEPNELILVGEEEPARHLVPVFFLGVEIEEGDAGVGGFEDVVFGGAEHCVVV